MVKLVPIKNRLFIESSYFNQGIANSLQDIYLREQALNRLLQALNHLPLAYSLIVYDGFRPLQVQQVLFDQIKLEITKKYPSWNMQQIEEETLKYVAFPSMDSQYPAPHLTGGAIDLTLGDAKGNPLDLGTAFDETSAQSATAYFESHLAENTEALNNRRILFHSMTNVGFHNYEEEWWHYDFGNVTWARKSKLPNAIYGPIIANIKKHELKEYRYK
ncbi:M15 family metallopeptidase [Solibacillus sp. MA9]|uniref:D-alanyl-D-alanine dipeptidase n=1 Tax=Solibacillus palustris TaxID=2908203 RepID=A0ABS9UBY3_9BACL|nr:M15 family metallopeptidase [Solibacillus sp. MA9]MCH7321669.1 M15 family metallopeptidase [Solibacillus sp. MA9]